MHAFLFYRLKESCAGIVVGVVLLCASFPVLVWNEGRTVRRYKTLVKGIKVVISPSADVVDPFINGMLLHLEGKALAGSDVAYASFGVGPIDLGCVR